MKWLGVLFFCLTGVVSAEAFTCDQVRSLSSEQRAYYIRVYSITPAQQDRIRQECYGPKGRHANERHGQGSETPFDGRAPSLCFGGHSKDR
jgi:hypothetical protein